MVEALISGFTISFIAFLLWALVHRMNGKFGTIVLVISSYISAQHLIDLMYLNGMIWFWNALMGTWIAVVAAFLIGWNLSARIVSQIKHSEPKKYL